MVLKRLLLSATAAAIRAPQKRLAERLTRLWQNEGVPVLHVNDYYEHNSQQTYLLNNNYSDYRSANTLE